MILDTFIFQMLTVVKDPKGMDDRWIKIASRNKGKGISMSSLRTRG